MEHIDDILSSDLLKRYVLRDVTPEEVLKVDLLKVDHSAIRKELQKLEKTLKHTPTTNPSTSSSGTKECIIKNISGKEHPNTVADIVSEKSSTIYSWWSIAAGVILGILGTWLVIGNQPNKDEQALAVIEADLIKLEKDYEELNQQYTFINHAGTMPYLLEGKAFQKASQVIIYWNDDLEKSQLRVLELPAISNDQTYQLWADVDSEMKSLGVFDPTIAIVDAIDIYYMAGASSLNITVEPKGGSEHPTIETLTASVTI